MRLVFANTVPVGLSVHARGQLRWLSAQGLEVVALTSPGLGVEALMEDERVPVRLIPMRREIAPVHDLSALFRWFRVLLDLKPDVVVYGSPKASLLGSITSAVLRVPRRVYIAHGARFEGVAGVQRSLLLLVERLTCLLSSEVLAVSPSVRQRFLSPGLTPARKIRVVGRGSCNGIDTVRFSPIDEAARDSLRRAHGIAPDAVVLGFVGRLTEDKGVAQLFAAVKKVEEAAPFSQRLVLVLAGWREGARTEELQAHLRRTEVRYLGYVQSVEAVYRLSDVMLLPTKREGLPTTVLEASACGVPTVANSVTGAVDAVRDGETGFLVPLGDVRLMAERVCLLINDLDLRESMGVAGRAFVVDSFAQDRLWPALLSAYIGEGGSQ